MANKIENRLAILWVVFAVVGRLIPHVPNVTPMIGVSLFAANNLSRKLGWVILFATLVISDAFLALVFGYPLFSMWTLFTYSGFAGIMLLGTKFHVNTVSNFIGYVAVSSLGFWLWTNFGVWLTSGLYPNNIHGLFDCYVAALPFLRSALFGDLAWSAIIFGSFKVLKRQLTACC